jgi:periplasmic divalent cation tolerance protein
MSDDLELVLTTVDDRDRALEIARQLVREKLVACAQLGASPVWSVWWWEGQVEEGEEWLLLLKLPPERLEPVRSRLHELHPYDTPEFVVLDATASAAYARWARESLT